MDPIFAALVFFRWIHFCAMVVLFGGALFWAYAPGVAGGDRAAFAAPWRFGLRCLTIAAPVALATGACWLVATLVDLTGLEGLGDPDTLYAFFFETQFGPIELARMGLLVVLVILAVAPMRDRRRVAAIGMASGLLLVSQAWLGHAAEGRLTLSGAMAIAAYGVHVLAGAAWLGGLLPLLAGLASLRRHAGPAASSLRLLSRYSSTATLAVVLILASGIANAAFRVQGHLGALLHTGYCGVLIVKVALVGLMLSFAAFNRFVAMPRLRGSGAGASRAMGQIATSVVCEMVLGAVVLAAAAVLGITPPPG